MTLFYNALAFFAPLAVDKFESSLLPNTEELQRRIDNSRFRFCLLPNYQDYKIANYQNCKLARLQDCKLPRLQDFQIAKNIKTPKPPNHEP
jgi:hypothetical protein